MDIEGILCEVRTEVLFYIIQVNLSFQMVKKLIVKIKFVI